MDTKIEITITGRRPAMVAIGLRLPPEDAKILNRASTELRCKRADLLRTSWQEFIVNHALDKDS